MRLSPFKNFFLQEGRDRDQVLVGSTRAGGSLALDSTTHEEKGPILLGHWTLDRKQRFFGNVPQPSAPLHVAGRVQIDNSADLEGVALQADLLEAMPAGSATASFMAEVAGQLWRVPLIPIGPAGEVPAPPPGPQTRNVDFRWNVAAAAIAPPTWPSDDFQSGIYPVDLAGRVTPSGHTWTVETLGTGMELIDSAAAGIPHGRARRKTSQPQAFSTLSGGSANGILVARTYWLTSTASPYAGIGMRKSAAGPNAGRFWAVLARPGQGNYYLAEIDMAAPGNWSGTPLGKVPAQGDMMAMIVSGNLLTIQFSTDGGANYTTYYSASVTWADPASTRHGLFVPGSTESQDANKFHFDSYLFVPT